MWKMTAAAVCVLIAAVPRFAFAQSDPAEIVNASLRAVAHDSIDWVYSIGEIRNLGSQALDDIVIEARYYDADGELVDVAVERLYSISVPPGEQVAFRIESFAMADADSYARQALRVVSYSEIGLSDCAGLAVTTKPQRGVFMQILISSFPILLLIGVWIYFIRRMNKKGSPQERTMELIAEQNEIVRQQGQAIERIADAIDKRDPG